MGGAGVHHTSGSRSRREGNRAAARAAGRSRLSGRNRDCVGEGTSRRPPGRGGASSRGAGDAIRRVRQRYVEGGVPAPPQSLPPQSVDGENAALVLSASLALFTHPAETAALG